MLKKAKAKPRLREADGRSARTSRRRCSIRRTRSGSPASARSHARSQEGTQGVRDAGASRARSSSSARRSAAAGDRGGCARRRDRKGEGDAANGRRHMGQAGTGVRGSGRPCAGASSASTRKTTCRSSPTASRRCPPRSTSSSTGAPAPKTAQDREEGEEARRGNEAERRARKLRRKSHARPAHSAGPRPRSRRVASASFAVELLDLLDVVLHRFVAAHALELRPRVVFGAADEIEAARDAPP